MLFFYSSLFFYLGKQRARVFGNFSGKVGLPLWKQCYCNRNINPGMRYGASLFVLPCPCWLLLSCHRNDFHFLLFHCVYLRHIDSLATQQIQYQHSVLAMFFVSLFFIRRCTIRAAYIFFAERVTFSSFLNHHFSPCVEKC